MSVLAWIRAHGCQVETTAKRAAGGLVAGALIGSALVAVGMGVLIGFSSQDTALAAYMASAPAAVLVFLYALPAFSTGLLAATPIWSVLHRVGVRCWSASSPLGALLSGGTMYFFTGNLAAAAGLAVVGAVVGAVIWKVAYRHTGVCVAS